MPGEGSPGAAAEYSKATVPGSMSPEITVLALWVPGAGLVGVSLEQPTTSTAAARQHRVRRRIRDMMDLRKA